MFNRKTHQIILEVPKCGSRSMVRAAEIAAGKRVFAHHGHHTLQELYSLVTPPDPEFPLDVVSVARSPDYRLISQLNHYCYIKSATLAEAYKACLEQSHVLFKPQYQYYILPPEKAKHVRLRVWTLTDIGFAFEAVGGARGLRHHVNDGSQRQTYSSFQITEHPLFHEAMRLYQPDWAVFQAAKRGSFLSGKMGADLKVEHCSPMMGERA